MLTKRVGEIGKSQVEENFDLMYANEVPVQKIHTLKCKINIK